MRGSAAGHWLDAGQPAVISETLSNVHVSPPWFHEAQHRASISASNATMVPPRQSHSLCTRRSQRLDASGSASVAPRARLRRLEQAGAGLRAAAHARQPRAQACGLSACAVRHDAGAARPRGPATSAELRDDGAAHSSQRQRVGQPRRTPRAPGGAWAAAAAGAAAPCATRAQPLAPSCWASPLRGAGRP